MKQILRLSTFAALSLSLVLSSCGSGARVMEEDEGNLIDKEAMGIEGYERLTEEAMSRLLAIVREKQGNERGKIMAYMGLINETNEPGRGTDVFMSVAQKTQALLANSGTFEIMPDLVIKAASREAGITRFDRLLLAKPRQQFMETLGNEGQQPDYFFYGTVNSATTEGYDVRQKNYYINYKVIDSRRGTLYATVNTADKSFRKMYDF
jgi:hypothetical protein